MLVIAVYRAIFDSPSVKKITKVIWLYFNYLSTIYQLLPKRGSLHCYAALMRKHGAFCWARSRLQAIPESGMSGFIEDGERRTGCRNPRPACHILFTLSIRGAMGSCLEGLALVLEINSLNIIF